MTKETSNAVAQEMECDFCRTKTRDACAFHRWDKAAFGQTAILCRDCIRKIMCEMAYTDLDDFERMVAEARKEQA